MNAQQATDTKAEIIEASIDLLLKMGWAGFSYKDIAEVVGIRKASIHYHFPGKEDLGLAIIAHWRETYGQLHVQVENEFSDVYQRLAAFTTMMLEFADDCHICPAGILDADFMNLPESMQLQTREWHEAKLQSFSGWLEEG
ncbi:MAG: TetR/AcrR family transcriptional regulator, partial [Planctomycetes bacterium]|nr:TetR/AcrR family transcriptional regulator [Planctomycetota bacterium]